MQQSEVQNAQTGKMEVIIKPPKNIRQIGDINDTYKIYIEDYVMTHIRQMGSRHGDLTPVVMVLVGQAYYGSETDYLFISGAVEFKGAEVEVSEVRLPDEGFKRVREKIAGYFPGTDIVGWSVTYPDAGSILTSALKKVHVSYFGERQKVLLEVSVSDEEENFYTFSQGQFVKQPGFYIYYDKNEAMQGYMIDCMEVRRERTTEKAVADRVPARFREAIREKKEEVHQHKIMTYLYAASIFLLMVVFVIGITMINNYEKMTKMEAALNYISENLRQDETVLTQEELSRFIEENSKKAAELASGDGTGPEARADQDGAVLAEQLPPSQGGEVSSATDKNPGGQGGGDTAAAENVEGQDGTFTAEGVLEGQDGTSASAGAVEDQDGTSASAGDVEDQDGTSASAGDSEDPAGAPAAAETIEGQGGQEQTSESAGGEDALAASAQSSGEQGIYYVQEGDTLAGISQKFYGTKSKIFEICEYNHIEDMNKILCGQKILLP